jgi:outer membrane lipoprotein-sorting protein
MRAALPLLLLLFAGCPPANVQRPYAPPTADELLSALRARADKLRSLHAEARADHMGEGGERVKVSVEMMLERGGKMRLAAENPLGGAVATLVSDGQQFALLDAQHNRFLAGPARACNVARLVRVALDPDDIVAALMGGAPLAGTASSVGWDPTHGGREVVTLRTDDGGEEKLFLDARDRRWDVSAAERRDAAGKLVWRLEHEDFADRGGLRLPGKTWVEDPPHHADVRIRFRSSEPNVTPKPGIFHLDPPTGIAVEPANC